MYITRTRLRDGESLCATYSDSCVRNIIEPRHEKTQFCLCENKAADQLRSNCKADQRLCFRYTDSTISLLHKSEHPASFLRSFVAVQTGLSRT